MNNPFALLPHDYERLAKSTISPKMADSLGLFRVDDVTGKQYVGKELKFGRNFAGLVIPYYSPFTGSEVSRRLRRDEPDLVMREDGIEKQEEK